LISQLIPIEDINFEYLKSLLKNDQDIAEICDFFLTENIPEEYKLFGSQKLKTIKGVSKNVFDSSQNLHDVSADIEHFVEIMMEFDCSSLATLLMRFPNHEDIINRISIDNALYSSKAITLLNLTLKSWTCIQLHKSRQELEKRFEQELNDMVDTCSSGHLIRLVNVFSGWIDSIKLDIKIELKSIIFYRLTKLINNLSDEDKNNVINEIGSIDMNQQINIQTKLLKYVSALHDELRKDYNGLIDNQKFEEYFRNSLMEFTIEK